ncbi:peptidase S58 DmpA [Emticicia oligotrophica DSM 17448]|uniref:Peptidase S58 DmpA n=1 Tax=Emticicia oligotrophica (strain DSM 17448 / CIP 109782 / MTCC 6937 / GPTSA100-15) TaxID=929562 RepID=A0ABM5N0Z4_EMTOG|nr:P1 family peptidase [Emticicia oligotrophica]AFK03093.1 peptidase S58 DmpA [Emticicia oligotrophica DSM 17448]
MPKHFPLFVFLFLLNFSIFAQKKRARDFGIEIGVLRPGKLNAITDVAGVKVGQVTLHQGNDVHTGVTAILPHDKNIFQNKIPAAIHIGNGFGKLAGYSQVEELGNLETPIILTNTLSVPTAAAAVIDYTFQFLENNSVRSVNAVVGETNDGGLNDIRKRFITKEHVLEALKKAQNGPVEEGNVGAGAGTVCFGFKGGIGTSSRILPKSKGGYTVGVLVQSNFGGVLQINGAPVGIELDKHKFSKLNEAYKDDGSCMIVVLTDAPLSAKNLKRLASRAMLGLARTGGIAANGSGDYVIAASTAEELRIAHNSDSMFETFKVLRNNDLDLLFEAVIEATEEAIINSLFAAETLTGFENTKVEALPIDKTIDILKKYNRIK